MESATKGNGQASDASYPNAGALIGMYRAYTDGTSAKVMPSCSQRTVTVWSVNGSVIFLMFRARVGYKMAACSNWWKADQSHDFEEISNALNYPPITSTLAYPVVVSRASPFACWWHLPPFPFRSSRLSHEILSPARPRGQALWIRPFPFSFAGPWSFLCGQ